MGLTKLRIYVGRVRSGLWITLCVKSTNEAQMHKNARTYIDTQTSSFLTAVLRRDLCFVSKFSYDTVQYRETESPASGVLNPLLPARNSFVK